jgi:carboxyl-terminal processing protease
LYRRLYQINEKDRLASYLKAYTESFDPHSEYMPPQEKEDFDIKMTGQLEGIGAQLTEQNGYVKVARIVPGSPSWKQGILKAGDIILKVAQGEGEPLSIVDMRIDDAIQFIRGKKGTEVRLTVKKPDGSIVIVPIIRDIVILEDTYAKSAVIKINNSDKRFGYINLPSYYVDFNNRNARRSATDVALEIDKLKKDGVDGIIVDLRNNLGGSLPDAVEMSGLFIKDGPIVQVKSRDGQPEIWPDQDSRIQYDGDLVIMVNTLSASASEIMAAALQDYGRAVIVGAPTTYGKGTVQTFIELDRFLNNNFAEYRPLGVLKLTIQKFYRVNGGATQLKGVVPDIILPDLYEAIEIGEKDELNAMQWDEIAPCSFNKWPLPVGNMQQIKDLSRERVEKSSTFQLIKQNITRLKTQTKITKYSLNIKEYREQQSKLNAEAKKYDKMFDTETKLSVISLSTDNMAMLNDSIKMTSTNAWHKELAKDAYLEEAVNIIEDMK